MSDKSPERLELEAEASKLGVEFKHNISDEKLLERVVEAQEAENKVPPLEVLQNKLRAYGVPDDQVKGTVDECEQQLQRVLHARAIAAKKRAQQDQGDYYGKTAKVRITHQGDNRIGTGEYIAGVGNLCYSKGETPTIPLQTAEVLQEKGWVEIV